MATQKKIVEMIAVVKTVYPYYAKETDVKRLVKTWSLLLKDYPDEAVEVAFYKCLTVCKMPPTPADVISSLKAICKANEPTDEELWNVYVKLLDKACNKIRCFGYTFVDANGKTQGENAKDDVRAMWNALPDKIKQYCGSIGEFMRVSRSISDEELKYERNRFLKTMPAIEERIELKALANIKLKELSNGK